MSEETTTISEFFIIWVEHEAATFEKHYNAMTTTANEGVIA